MKRCFLLFASFLLFLPAQALSTDSLKVSLLTVEPRPAHVYTVYGHTALRLYDPSQYIDMVFNWGTFDVDAPHFLYHFILGETDYFLSYTNYAQFLNTYMAANVTVIEQVLDLSSEGKELLIQKLSANLQPENLIYRYNFLFDNCTTRVRDLIELSSPGLVYPVQTETTTFRKLIHSCTESYRWMTFGIDLLIGSGADSLISVRQELFLPEKLEEALDPTPVVTSSQKVLKAGLELDFMPWPWESPFIVGFTLLTIYIIVAVYGWLKQWKLKGGFAPLFFIAGAAGCLLAFMAAFSDHPCVSANWNLLWLHPFYFIAFTGCFLRKPYRLITWYHSVNFVLLCGLLLGWHWIPQALNPADIPFILCLALASGYWILINKKHYRV
ncbi:membrane protein [Bacteroidia bacterium]|nr:membrane protein [Bacteroidia bacterium]